MAVVVGGAGGKEVMFAAKQKADRIRTESRSKASR